MGSREDGVGLELAPIRIFPDFSRIKHYPPPARAADLRKRSLCHRQSATGTFDQSARCWQEDLLATSIAPVRKCHRLAGGGAFLFLAFRATQEVALRRLRVVSTVIGAVSSAGVGRSRASRILVRAISPSLPSRRSRLAGSRLPPVPAASFSPQSDSQVAPVPPSLVTRRHGAAEAGCPPAERASLRAGLLRSSVSGPLE